MRKVFKFLIILSMLLVVGCKKEEEVSEEIVNTGEPVAVNLVVQVPDTNDSALYALFTNFKATVEGEEALLTVELRAEENATKGAEELTKVLEGDLDLAIISKDQFRETSPFMSMFDAWFLFLDYEHYRTAMDDKVGTIMLDKISDDSQTQVIGSLFEDTKIINIRGYKDIKTIDDFYSIDLGVASTEVSVEAAKTLGANAVVIVPTNTYRYLAEHIINGYDGFTKEVHANKYYEITDSVINSNHVFDFSLIVMNDAKWNSCSALQKDIIRSAITDLEIAYERLRLEEHIELLGFYEDYGLAVNNLNKEEFFYAFQEMYRGNVEYTNAWNKEYYERIIKLGINLINERKAEQERIENEETGI